MKNQLRFLFQKILGYRTYLFIFALYNIRRMKWGGGHEKEFIYFLDMLPAGPGILLDIGANIGVMSAAMAGRRPDTRVYAFEPIPDNQAAIERVIKFLGIKNIDLFKTALGEENGE
ncbi:MAG TPA: FkbM family methyltransferase, partial [Sediminibacterium sp.]|nr:FkbM family methyltransferase [Sediminibacterium sp.]